MEQHTDRQIQNLEISIAKQNSKYMTRSRRNLVMPFEHADFSWYWDTKEIQILRKLWAENARMVDMVQKIGKNAYEIIIMVMSEMDQGKIERRGIGLGICEDDLYESQESH
jgi:hypothetical protein